MFFAAIAAIVRSTSISPAWGASPSIGADSRAASGTSRNRLSTEGTPMVASIDRRSASVRGR